MPINDPTSVDYVPSLHLGYEKEKTPRQSATSRRACYFSDCDIARLLDDHARREITGIVPPSIGAEVTIGDMDSPTVLLREVAAEDICGSVGLGDHAYSKHPSLAPRILRTPSRVPAANTVDCQTQTDRLGIFLNIQQQVPDQMSIFTTCFNKRKLAPLRPK